jgi:Rod binding domain-containing protein
MGLGPLSVSPDLLATSPKAPSGDTREKIAKTAKEFESSFISIMLGEMFKGVGQGEFSGGQGGAMFQSFLMDAFSKQMSKTGGIGLSSSVQHEMLKMQGLDA